MLWHDVVERTPVSSGQEEGIREKVKGQIPVLNILGVNN